METTRQKKVSKTILKDLSKIFQKKTYEFLGPILVTITDVAVTRDLSIAKVYLSLFPKRLDVFEEITLRRLKIKHQLIVTSVLFF